MGDWGGWLALHELKYKGVGTLWECDVNVPVGTHEFKFLIDGEWKLGKRYDIVDDGVGTTGNNILTVRACEISCFVGALWELCGHFAGTLPRCLDLLKGAILTDPDNCSYWITQIHEPDAKALREEEAEMKETLKTLDKDQREELEALRAQVSPPPLLPPLLPFHCRAETLRA